jgi:hypothetical protein
MNRLSIVVVVVAAVGLVACSAGVKPSTPGTAGSSAAGTTGGGGRGGSGTGAGGTGAPGMDGGLTDITVGETVGPDSACFSQPTLAQPVPLDLYVLMDASLSMNEMTTAGTTKWADVRTAMGMFFDNSPGLGVGLKFFPGVQSGAPATCTGDGTDAACGNFGPCDRRKTCVGQTATTTNPLPLCTSATTCGSGACALVQECAGTPVTYCAAGPGATGTPCQGCNMFNGYCHLRDICTPTYYATPDVAVGTLPAASTALKAALTAKSPAGYTPTGPALTGALTFARQRLTSDPTHKIAVVLVTDGLPGGFLTGIPPAECTPGDIAGISTLASGPQGAGGTPAVLTFVIGVFSPGMAAQTAQTNLDMLATAGGTAPAVIINTGQDVTAALQNALKTVQSKAIACEYQVPSQGVDFKKVNVQFTNGAGTTVTPIGHAPIDGTDGAGCDARGGWYYDKDPMTGAPTKIKACPATCTMLQTDLDGKVDVVLGCPTIDVG